MTEQNFESLRHLVKRAAIHSQQFRHSGYSSRDLSDDEIRDIGFQLVTLFESLYEKRLGDTGGRKRPKKAASPEPDCGRVRSRPQPYR